MRIRTPADFGVIARQQRRDLKLSQSALAERSGVTRQWLVRFERGSSDVSLSKACAVLAELNLLVRVDSPRSEAETTPRLVIPGMTVSELDVDEAKLSRAREAIRLLYRNPPQPTVRNE